MTTPPLIPELDETDGAGAAAGSPGPLPTLPTKRKENSEYRLPPGLRLPLYFYAHKPWVKLGEPIRLFEYLQARYGEISCYSFMGTYIVFLNRPEYIREILINQAGSFIKERTLQRMKILLGEGLITSDDPIHMRQRKLAAPAFHRGRIAAYAGEIASSAAAHRDRWHAGQKVDMNAAMMHLSLEITARTLFETEVTDDVRSINDEVNLIMGIYNFLVAFPKIESVLHLPIPGVRKFRRSRERLDAIVGRIISTRRQEMKGENKEASASRGDLLSMLLASRYEAEDGTSAPETGMNDVQIRDEVLTIFLAGYETVANALTWTWYLLSQNPKAEMKLYAELRQVLGPNEAGALRLPTLADIPQLRYTEMVFAESMRLYPPAWAMGRMSTAPVTLGPYRIPVGAHFFFSQYMMHRTPEYFPDPLRFDPERHTPENKAGRDKFAYFPFGGGSRQCIGESFAWMEGILAVATIASRWRMRYANPEPPIPQAKITLRPKFPMMMVLESR